MKSTLGRRAVQHEPQTAPGPTPAPGLEHVSGVLSRIILAGRSGKSWAGARSEAIRLERRGHRGASARGRRPA